MVGTLTKFKSFLGDDQNDKAILVPYNTFKKMYPEAKDNFICVLVEPGKMEQAKGEVTELLRRRRHVKPSDPDNFGISSAESVIGQFRQVIGTVALVMVVISSIGLLVGGIGVMNIMLVSVTPTRAAILNTATTAVSSCQAVRTSTVRRCSTT